MGKYEDLIARKTASAPPAGFIVNEQSIAPHLFPHQRDLVRWALRRGRAAIFAETGLGKAIKLLEWARHVAADHGRVLILAPLAVGPQIAVEAVRFGVDAQYVRDDRAELDITITNYEMLKHFEVGSFAGVVLDESSILKSFEGKYRNYLIDSFSDTPFRLCCTATPAPNDFTELGNHSEFLGIKSRAEMLAEYFVHDGGSTQDWRIKGHAVEAFWRWVATWGAVVRKPSDLGYDDGAYELPPLTMQDHVVETLPELRTELGFGPRQMYAKTLTEQRKARRATIAQRVDACATLVREYTDGGEQVVVWCDLNDEQNALAEVLGARLCVSIEGATKDDVKLERHERWKRGKVSCLVSKAAIFGFGLNWQHCSRVVFIGASHSYERTYQAIRRCWRFGQRNPVTVDMVRADLEGAVADNYRRKEHDHKRMGDAMVELVGAAIRAEVRGLAREFNPYDPQIEMVLPAWLSGAKDEVRCDAAQ